MLDQFPFGVVGKKLMYHSAYLYADNDVSCILFTMYPVYVCGLFAMHPIVSFASGHQHTCGIILRKFVDIAGHVDLVTSSQNINPSSIPVK